MVLTKRVVIVALFSAMGSAPLLTSPAFGEVIFEDNFDDQPDWTSTMFSTEKMQKRSRGAVLPNGWDLIYQDTKWSPETGYINNHASLEILETNADKARGGEGKAAVMWRESHSLGWLNWASDSQLWKYLEGGYEELYVEFYIRFSDNWWQRSRGNTGNWTSKILRVGSWDGVGDEVNGAAGSLGPIVFWDYKQDDYGMRNVLAFRGGPWGENYRFNGQYSDGVSLNYTKNTAGNEEDGKNPLHTNALTGAPLVSSSTAWHEDVFGPPAHWTKMAFYVKMNSAPGVKDGVFRQWINGHRIVNKENVPWVMENSENIMVKWNYIAIGGNDYLQPIPNEQRFEDWYAIDDLVIHSSMPYEKQMVAPNPPVGIGIK
ncbi:hypothetical protein [Marinobacter xiaoshiensis]|uniref:Polysaccharide lyase n=1 Tax=Marinobacter xiaoshiensis TaxID=3073652 RepID=A0ABU2HFT2_9GAMM|nr:hypothetical protein [Marinobacter sp. F60267]MDS1309933.1 hypothetical protein [Marinobacter sp. F60267]